MTDINKARADLTGPHNAGREDEQEVQAEEGEKIEDLNRDINVTQDLVSWTKTPAGRDTITKLRHQARKAMNEMFSVLHEGPEITKLISAVARFEATVQMTQRFTGAEEDLDTMLEELSRRRPNSEGR